MSTRRRVRDAALGLKERAKAISTMAAQQSSPTPAPVSTPTPAPVPTAQPVVQFRAKPATTGSAPPPSAHPGLQASSPRVSAARPPSRVLSAVSLFEQSAGSLLASLSRAWLLFRTGTEGLFDIGLGPSFTTHCLTAVETGAAPRGLSMSVAAGAVPPESAAAVVEWADSEVCLHCCCGCRCLALYMLLEPFVGGAGAG